VLDVYELQEQLAGAAVLAAAKLAALVGKHGVDPNIARLEGWQHVIVDQLDGGDRQLVGIEVRPGMPAVAADRGLQIHPADALEGADEEGVDGDEGAGVWCLDVALPVPGLNRSIGLKIAADLVGCSPSLGTPC